MRTVEVRVLSAALRDGGAVVLGGLISHTPLVRIQLPLRSGSSALVERHLDTVEAGGSIPSRSTSSRGRLLVGPGSFKPMNGVRFPVARPFSRSSTGGAARC